MFFVIDFYDSYIGYFAIVSTFLAGINKGIMVIIIIIIQELRFSLTRIFLDKDGIYNSALVLKNTETRKCDIY